MYSIVICWFSSESNVTVIHGTQTFTVAGSAPRCKANLCSFYELSRANAICFKQLEHCTTILMCTFLIEEPSRLFGCTYTCIVHVGVCNCILVWVPKENQTLSAFTSNNHSRPVFRNSKVSGAGSSKGKNLWVMTLLLKKTMSEKSLITKYALRNILPGNANIQKIL